MLPLFITGCAQQRDPPQHRQHDEHGPGLAEQRQDELLAAGANVIKLFTPFYNKLDRLSLASFSTLL
jgi:hypothetical protein